MFAQAADAQIWLNIGTVSSRIDILKTDDRFKEFRPFNESKLYNNNKRINKFGGNDYWESGLTNPHIVLNDMIKILHPELLPGHELVYYTRIE
jgi:iron complex transport system substrate-binding protein